jgi:hypothetical protein
MEKDKAIASKKLFAAENYKLQKINT